MKQLPNKQQGFTLLELLVVITLLAVLAVGALVAYDGVGDKAEAAAAANANVNVDNMIRQYKAVSSAYPNQWDSLAAANGSLIDALPAKLKTILAPVTTATDLDLIAGSLGKSGINELQFWNLDTASSNSGVLPNLAHNESFNSGNADEVEFFDAGNVVPGELQAIAALKGLSGCQLSGAAAAAVFDQADNVLQNRYNDKLEDDECHLVVALGFGSDAAASTTGASVQIGKAPSFSKTDSANPENNVNPNTQYTRYVGLFLVASDGNDDNDITSDEYLDKARLIAMIAPDGTVSDENLANATKN